MTSSPSLGSPRHSASSFFHHDPLRDDEQLDRLHAEAPARWEAAGRSPHELLMAAELQELEPDRVGAVVAAAAAQRRPPG